MKWKVEQDGHVYVKLTIDGETHRIRRDKIDELCKELKRVSS